INLRDHQLKGVRWLVECLNTSKGCILGDEMGLGKTCQAISLLLYARGHLKTKGPFLVLCPLTVLQNWQDELTKISPSLSVICYHGDKQERENLQKEMNEKKFDVLLTHYTLCRNDASVLRRWKWEILVVDEAQEIKNIKSKLHQILTEFNVNFKLLLTGTPIQNNVQEVYSLLTFIQPHAFPPGAIEDFVNTYKDVQTGSSQARDLHEVIRPFLLRRVKVAVETNLPKKEQILIHHGMSSLQKSCYKAILMKDLSVIEGDKGGQNRLLNILMQLRKCVNHPYLFNGVEPEPYEIGEHLVKASGKLSLLDKILAFLSDNGHRVLLFSQMTRMLDIVQDYLEYRGYSYERVDGSVRREERNLSIRNFKTKDIFILLLSTKAGGVGLNLTEADTVIFLDNDFNPQNDLQALSRAHRIGQTRPVKVIRLCGRDTVEEIILSRAASKLRLTDTVIEEGHFSQMDNASDFELKEILTFGTSSLLATDESFVLDVDLEESLGRSENGKWLIEEKEGEEENITAAEDEDKNRPHRMYSFEGMDYSKVPSTEDKYWIACRLAEQSAVQEDTETEGHHLRSKTRALFCESLPSTSRIKRCLTESELEERRRKKEESSAKRARVLEEKKKQREDQKYKKKMAWWESCGYKSLCLPSADCESEDEDVDVEDLINRNLTDTDDTEISYVLGDVTHPKAKSEDAIIVHCVDDSGHWGRGGLFTALVSRSDEVKKQYELAGDMEDLELGRVLMFPIDDKQSRACGTDYLALIVSQKRDKDNNLSGILLSALDEGLKMISRVAKQKKASVHLPRIGHDTKGFNWYGTERLIRKHLASRGVPTFIYYFKRADSHSSPWSSSSSGSSPIASTSRDASGLPAPAPVSPGSSGSLDPPGPSGVQPKGSRESSSSSGQGGRAPGLPEFMRGVHVHFYNMEATERKKLARQPSLYTFLLNHLCTYDGDEEDLMSRMVTHVVAEVENPVHIQDLQEMSQQYPQAILVKKKWLESCFANQRKVAVSKFLHR
ncbi:chromodomain-helicase-DNA-binding protein 1-like, partial [Silurus meridionalis]